MRFLSLCSGILEVLNHRITTLDRYIKHWFQPAKSNLILGTIADVTRSKAELIAENALLRQQLIALQRQTKRPGYL